MFFHTPGSKIHPKFVILEQKMWFLKIWKFLKIFNFFEKLPFFRQFFKNFEIFENHIFCSKIKNFGRILLPGVWKNIYFSIAFHLWALEINCSLLTIKFLALNIFFATIWRKSCQFQKEVAQLQKKVDQVLENFLNFSEFFFH